MRPSIRPLIGALLALLVPVAISTSPAAAQQAPPEAVPVAQSGGPWIGDITFGNDPSGNGSVPSGGKLPFTTETTYAFFSWRSIPPGAKIGVDLRREKQTYWKGDFAPSAPQGRIRVAMFSGAASGGTGPVDFVLPPFEIVLTLDSQEMARGWIQPGG